ncbi:MAG: histidinol-phosphate transaminase [Gammaproteobacteria bacterium]|nr:histidinol-phosphate transaminase [Gammaproteobacteria bacterium]NIR96563.1 histidinol-phosphate transaminase [Gammaproteobacteria bacterium]NIT62301.1 histidinol-phosphate transaminase [Gammaproteobacteria bacterium]NIV19205.1 histidinol-phosphate transaminase [Gammaproteobacteria bacterium]NIX10073.1 histidinol-phosphate transaminase [Gammaproteobacteria bacterium]
MIADLPNFLDLAQPGVRSLSPYEPGKPLEELEREYGISGAVKLASNENPLGISPLALKAAVSALEGVARYPDGNGFALKRALAEKHGIGSEHITLGNGSNDVLELVARTFLGPGTNAVFSEHAFAIYPIATQAVGAEARVASASPADRAIPYGHDLEAIAARMDEGTGVVFIANPNNPTGTWLARAELEGFLHELPGSVIAVVDEAYFEYVEEPDYPDASRWLERYPNLLVTRTFSKIYGLAGLRVGYGLSHPRIADLLNRVRQPFNVGGVAQAAALGALTDRDHVRRSISLNRKGLRQLGEAFERMGLGVIPSAANFLAVDVGRPAGGVYEALLRRGVIVRPVASYGLPTFLRITVGAAKENMAVIEALREVLDV